MPMIDDALKPDVIKWCAFYEHRIRLGSVSPSLSITLLEITMPNQKHIFHLEAFVAKFMRILEGYVTLEIDEMHFADLSSYLMGMEF